MKKRYIAGLALALMGILSGCGQAKTQPADNTISITPVEQATTDEPQIGCGCRVSISPAINTEANGIDIQQLHHGMAMRGRTWTRRLSVMYGIGSE